MLITTLVTQETENNQGLDGGALGVQRKLYYRELIARFSHHLGLVWNLGEENTNTIQQRQEFARFIKEYDPYNHAIVMHSYPHLIDTVYTPMLGLDYFDGPALQTNDVHSNTINWIDQSSNSGHPWVVTLDEVAHADSGVLPDSYDYWHDDIRKKGVSP